MASINLNIHHATRSKALREGYTIAVSPAQDGVIVIADDRHYKANTGKEALSFALTAELLRAEYPIITLAFEDGVWVIRHGDEIVITLDELPDFGDVVDHVTEEGFDPDEQAEGEEEDDRSGGVVPVKYKTIYAERGDANHCGDWLAQQLDTAFVTTGTVMTPRQNGKATTRKERKFDVDGYCQCLVDQNKLTLSDKMRAMYIRGNSNTRGWQGRFRMSTRLSLEVTILKAGFLVIDHRQIALPVSYREALATKHPKVEVDWTV